MKKNPIPLRKILNGFRSEFSFVSRNFIVLIVSQCLFSFGLEMSAPFESLYIRELGASPFVLGLITATGTAVLCIFQIPGAYIADKYGRKEIILKMSFGMALSYLIYILSPSWQFMFIALLLSNFFLIYQPALKAIEADSIPPEKRSIGYATLRVIPLIPAILSPTIAGFLTGTFTLNLGMRIVYSIVFICLLATAFIRMSFRETLGTVKKIKFKDIIRNYKDSTFAMYEALMSMSRSLKFLTLVSILSAFEEPMFFMFCSLYAIDVVGVNGVQWGLAFSFLALMSLVVGLPVGKVIDTIGKKRSMILAYLLFISSTTCFIFARGFIPLLVAFALDGLGAALLSPAHSALLADMTPRDRRGRVLGAIRTTDIMFTVPSIVIGGYLYQIYPSSPFILSMAFGIVIIFVLFSLVHEPEKKEV
jgi:MFS family permease